MDRSHILVYGMVGDHRGGIETFLLKMNQNMNDNVVFDYVIEEKVCIHEEEIKSRGGLIHFISSRNKHPFNNLIDNFRLLKQLRKSVDTVYFNLSSLSWVFPILFARLFRYKVFVHSHNADFIAANSSIGYRAINFINKRWLHYFKVRRLTCSKPATDFMFMPSDKVEMIYNAINVGRFAYDPDARKRKRAELCVDDNVFLLGFVGRLQFQKNPLYLATIMESIKDVPNVKMIVIGEGDMRPELEAKLRDDNESRVILLGNRTDVNELYQAMDLFLLPSFHEGLPFVAVEAQASGLNCFVSECVTKEIDCIGAVKFLELDKDGAIWRNEIINQINNKAYDRGQLSYKFQESPFDIQREAKRLESLLMN